MQCAPVDAGGGASLSVYVTAAAAHDALRVEISAGALASGSVALFGRV